MFRVFKVFMNTTVTLAICDVSLLLYLLLFSFLVLCLGLLLAQARVMGN